MGLCVDGPQALCEWNVEQQPTASKIYFERQHGGVQGFVRFCFQEVLGSSQYKVKACRQTATQQYTFVRLSPVTQNQQATCAA